MPNDPAIASYDRLFLPNALHWRIAAQCNLNCFFCEREIQKSGDKASEVDGTAEVWGRLRDDYLPHFSGLELAGLGEPTMAPMFPQAARECAEMGKPLYFPTNGSLLDKARVLDNVGEGPRVSVSLDAWDSESFDRVRRRDGKGPDWNRITKAVKTFRKEKPKAVLHSQFTAGRYNIEGLPLFIDAAAELGIKDVVMRFVGCHTPDTAREDVSLRFARDITEAAIEQASRRASKLGVWFEAERRPYSAAAPNGLADAAPSPAQRIRHYIEIVPLDMDDSSGGSSGGSSGTLTCPTFTGSNGSTGCLPDSTPTLMANGDWRPIGEVRPGDRVTSLSADRFRSPERISAVKREPGQECLRIVTDAGDFVCTASHTIMLSDWTIIAARSLSPGDLLIDQFDTPAAVIRVLAAERADVTIVSLDGPNHTFCAGGLWSHNMRFSIGSGIKVHANSLFLDMMPGRPVIVRSPKVPIQSAKPIHYGGGFMVVTGRGEAWSCFAGHDVGNVMTDSLADIITNPRYQAFLQARNTTNGFNEPLCRHCARTF